jgi:hypothetical protein
MHDHRGVPGVLSFEGAAPRRAILAMRLNDEVKDQFHEPWSEPREPLDAAAGGVPRSAVHATFRITMSSGAGGVMTDTGKSNYPVKVPMGVQLTTELVHDIAKLLETRGFPPFTDEDIGRLHLVLYDLLYEGHEDTVRLS